MIESHVRKLYNQYVRKINALEKDSRNRILDEIGKGEYITLDDLTWIKSHYEQVKEVYKSEKLGVYTD